MLRHSMVPGALLLALLATPPHALASASCTSPPPAEDCTASSFASLGKLFRAALDENRMNDAGQYLSKVVNCKMHEARNRAS